MTSIAAGSYPTGSGQTLLNLVTSPADGSSQTDYDFWLGLDGSVDGSDPAYNVVDGRAELRDGLIQVKTTTDFLDNIGLRESVWGIAAFYQTAAEVSRVSVDGCVFSAGPDYSVESSPTTKPGIRIYAGTDDTLGYPVRIRANTGANNVLLDFDALEPVVEQINYGLSISATNGGKGYIILNGRVVQFCLDKAQLTWSTTSITNPVCRVFGGHTSTAAEGRGALYRIEAYNKALTYAECKTLYNTQQVRYGLPTISSEVDTDSDSSNVRILLDLDGDSLDRSGFNNHFSVSGTPFINNYGIGTMDGLNTGPGYFEKESSAEMLELASTTLCNVQDFTLDFDLLCSSNSNSDQHIFSTESFSIGFNTARLRFKNGTGTFINLVEFTQGVPELYWNRVRLQRLSNRICVWVNNYRKVDTTLSPLNVGSSSVVRIGQQFDGSPELFSNVFGLKNLRFTLGVRTDMGSLYAQESVLTPYPTP